MNSQTGQVTALRMGFGAVLTIASMVALAWVLTTARGGLQYHQMPPLADTETDVSVLTNDSIRLAAILHHDPFNGVARKRLATVWARLGRYDQALEDLERAVQTNNTPDSLFFRSDMYEKLGKLPQAQEEMHKAIMLNPSNPQYNASYLRLLGMIHVQVKTEADKGGNPQIIAKLRDVQARLADASINWLVRAPNDKNTFLFMGNYYVITKNYLQAYRCYLMGLSRSPWMNLNRDYMIEPKLAIRTIDQILLGGYAKPYRGLTFGMPAGKAP